MTEVAINTGRGTTFTENILFCIEMCANWVVELVIPIFIVPELRRV